MNTHFNNIVKSKIWYQLVKRLLNNYIRVLKIMCFTTEVYGSKEFKYLLPALLPFIFDVNYTKND